MPILFSGQEWYHRSVYYHLIFCQRVLTYYCLPTDFALTLTLSYKNAFKSFQPEYNPFYNDSKLFYNFYFLNRSR